MPACHAAHVSIEVPFPQKIHHSLGNWDEL